MQGVRTTAMSPLPGVHERTRRTSQTPQLSTPPLPRRRSSVLSFASLDETKHSVQTSASDFVLPALGLDHDDTENEQSHLHSTPLVFAFLPAVGGLLFTNGNHFITDVLLLGLAAIFLNWSVRLPWSVLYQTTCSIFF